ncbi:hypothetical protein F8388_026642 [Cannabis sativa]|uniref:Uncharacterized protein n=1 Tax=Cannabis sativa TaxID=3483 RepID=A0A7J6EAL9_CANSA|nr:hypothetical protein F8388_026642 [Cannabis sativa]
MTFMLQKCSEFSKEESFGGGICRESLLIFSLLVFTSEGLNSEGYVPCWLTIIIIWETGILLIEPPCGWSGVNCNTSDFDQVVWSLDLRSMNLSGTISSSIGGLWGIPPQLGNLSNLTRLNVCNNKLSGSLPEELGRLSLMIEFVAYTNNLTGPLPRSIGEMKSLRTFRAGQNAISGSIPGEISGCQSLELLGLAQNHLGGGVAKRNRYAWTLDRLDSMGQRALGAYSRGAWQLCNTSEFSNLKSLTKLDLSINFLQGSIPSGFQYQLFDNSLNGTIPQGFGLYSQLWVVDFSDNHLTGRIPPHLCRNSNLILLNLETNKLYGNIPTGILNCKTLVQLRLVGNSLTGSFPSELCNLVNLSAIALDQNNWQRLHISDNYFNSEVPTEIGNLSQLVTFNLSSNLPHRGLDLSRNHFEGPLPDELGTLLQLEILRLSENRFTGSIPSALGNLSRLTELQMGGNRFSNEIPPELGSLSGLQIANES